MSINAEILGIILTFEEQQPTYERYGWNSAATPNAQLAAEAAASVLLMDHMIDIVELSIEDPYVKRLVTKIIRRRINRMRVVLNTICKPEYDETVTPLRNNAS